MKKKLSLIIPLLAIFCLISGGYALISNDMIADEANSFESPSNTDSVPNATITTIDSTNIEEDNMQIAQETSKPTTFNIREAGLNYNDEWIINSPEGTGITPPGYEEEEYTISDCMLAKIEHNLDYIKGNIDAGYTEITPEIYQAFVKLNVPNIDHYYKLLTDQVANEKVPTNVQPEISNSDVNSQIVPNENVQPEISTPDTSNNNPEISYSNEYVYI